MVVSGIFRSLDDADAATLRIKSLGIEVDAVSVIAKNEDDNDSNVLNSNWGLIHGVNTVPMPGMGVIVTSNPAATNLNSDQASGGVLGTLYGIGIPPERGREYVVEMKRGKALWKMECGSEIAPDIADCIRNGGAERVEIY